MMEEYKGIYKYKKASDFIWLWSGTDGDYPSEGGVELSSYHFALPFEAPIYKAYHAEFLLPVEVLQ